MRYSLFKRILVAIACLSVLSFAQLQLPTIKITTQNNAIPPKGVEVNVNNNFCPAGTYTTSMTQTMTTSSSPLNILNTSYILATGVQLSGADSRYNFTRTSQNDSIRRRGNSTANMDKIPFRLKFDKKVEMFGRPGAKSWTLMANYYDPSVMLNLIAFELGKRLKLDFTPNGYFVKLNLANKDMGVYLLTDQIQIGKASVDIDDKNGWLVEFDYHCASSAADARRFFHTGANGYNLNVKIRDPDLDDLPLNSSKQPDTTCLGFVKDDINTLVSKMKENSFPTNGYRDYIDLESYAKYIMIQLFMDNADFNGRVSSSTLLGSNYAYKNAGEKIKAGPIWDFDLAAGANLMAFGNPYFTSYTDQVEPRNEFYKRIWSDPVFKAKYKKIWDAHQSDFSYISNKFIDSVTNLVAGSIAGNIANNVSNVTEQSYRTHTGNLKTWWNNRLTHFGQEITKMNINTSADIAESAPAASHTRNCKEAVSSSSKASSSSAAVSSSSRASSSSVTSSSSNRSSSSTGTTLILLSQNVITLNQPGAKVEVYNLQGKQIYSYSGNFQILKIPVQTKGIYIVRITLGHEKKVQRLVVK